MRANAWKRMICMVITLSLLLGLLPTAAFAAESNYSDVKSSDWCNGYIQDVTERGLMNGTGDGTFSPNQTTSRGMIVTTQYRMAGSPAVEGTSAFTDVAKGQYYETPVLWASQTAIVNGYGNGNFGPNDLITREQLVTMLYRYAVYMGYDVSQTADLSQFEDADQISEYAKVAVSWAVAVGLLTGTSDTTLSPQGNATRAQLAAFLSRFCELFDGQTDKTETATFTVKFLLNDGTDKVYQTVQVKDGETAKTPTKPTRSGYTFKGWYTEKSGGTKFDFDAKVSGNVTVYAQWEKTTSSGGSGGSRGTGGGSTPVATYYTVTFESNGGSAVASQQVKSGECAIRPENPDRENYQFVNWYKDAEFTEVYDYSETVTANITVYARWTIKNVDGVIDLSDIENMIASDIVDVTFGDNGDIRTIDGEFTDQTIQSVADVVDVLSSAAPLFGSNFSVSENEITKQVVEDNDSKEESFFRFSPTVNGVDVLGSQIIISTDDKGKATGLYSSFNDKIKTVDTAPSIEESEAKTNAVECLLQDEDIDNYLNEIATEEHGKEELIASLRDQLDVDASLYVYPGDDDISPSLIYAVSVSSTISSETPEIVDDGVIAEEIIEVDVSEENEEEEESSLMLPYINMAYYIYANGSLAGEIFRTIDRNEGASSYQCAGKDLKGNVRTFFVMGENGTYWLRDSKRNIETYKTSYGGVLWHEPQLPGDIVTFSDGILSNRVDKAAVSAHANMKDVYDYYKNVLDRDSFDGKGAKIIVSYNYDDCNFVFTGDFANAFWDSKMKQFVFGDSGNYEAALDVMGHEFTHAVIDYTVGIVGNGGLTYAGESGALDESYADIMGSLVEGKTGSGLWLIGEDSDEAVRSMERPSVYGQPEHYGDRYIGDDDDDDDDGGVHTNSGIFNFAAYKMMTDSRTSSISKDTWANVFYRSLYRLTKDAKFLDARGAILASAKSLGFTGTQQQAIKDAFDAVGIKEKRYVKFVLRWDATPSDLDSHIVGPGVNNGSRFHVYFGQRSYYNDGSYSSDSATYAVDLDYDDTTSYGPEITTIHAMTPGTYYFYVHDYSNGSSSTSTEMAHSGATVEVSIAIGTLLGTVRKTTYSVDPSSSGTYWNVVKVTITEEGSVTMEEINTYGSAPSYS